ncbi:MAG TPA: hypothetical protein VGL31_15840 [Xanthobacteraceae bacterium]
MILCPDHLTLDELIGDPLTQAVMHADRVDPARLAASLRSLARQIGARSAGSAPALVEAASARFGRDALGWPAWSIGASRDAASGCDSQSHVQSRRCGAP